MLGQRKHVLVLLTLAILAWCAVAGLTGEVLQERDPAEIRAAADCTYLPSYRPMYLADPSRARSAMALKLKQADSGLPATGFFYAPAAQNFIDDLIFDKMARDNVSSASLSGDAEFLRRVYLDATGRIPTAAAVSEFLADTSVGKRERLIDSLLETSAYADRWTNWFGDRIHLTMASTQINLRPTARNAYFNSVRQSIGQNKPFNQLVSELLTASGDTTTAAGGAANFFVRWRQTNGPIQDTYDNLAAASGELLGMSLNCISCHDGAGHTNSLNLFLTQRSRYDLWALAAFFSRTQLVAPQRDANNGLIIGFTVADSTNPRLGYVLNTTTGNKTPREGSTRNEIVLPKYFPDGSASDGQGPLAGESYRAALARMLTSDRQFARATANYVWKELFGLGIVEPADNFDLERITANANLPEGWSLQASHPELLERLAVDFEQHGYDLKYLIGTILKSAAYQLSSTYSGTWSDSYIPYFARKFPRRLKSEEIFDVITQATNRPASYLPTGYASPVPWAMQLPDPDEPRDIPTRRLLDAFLRGDRDTRPRSEEGSISQALTLLNDTFVGSRVRVTAANGTVATLFANRATMSAAELVRQLFLATLSRNPSSDESAKAVAFLGSPISSAKLEDLQIALMNKVDFIFNY